MPKDETFNGKLTVPATLRRLSDLATPFQELGVSERTPVIEINASYAPSILRDIQKTEGNAEIKQIESEFELKHTTTGDKVAMLSASTGRYTPGVAAEAGVGVRFPDEIQGDAVAYFGYFNLDEDKDEILNGLVFGKDKDGNFISIFREGEEIEKWYQEEWNISSDYDASIGNVLQIRFTYYGYGLIEFRKLKSETGKEGQSVKTLHTFRPQGKPTIANSNLRVGAIMYSEQDDDNEYNLYLSGRQFSLLGPTDFSQRIVSHKITDKTIPVDGFTPIMSFRQKFANRAVPFTIQEYELITNNDVTVQWRVNSDLSKDDDTDLNWVTPSDHDPDEVSLQVNTDADNIDMNTGVKVNESIAAGGAGPTPRILGQKINLTDIPDGYPVTLCATAEDTEATLDIVIGKMTEER